MSATNIYASTEIKAVAFDLGGVVFSAGKEVAKQSWERRGYDSTLIRQLLISAESMQLRTGKMDDDTFWNVFFKKNVPDTYDVDLIKKLWYDGYVADLDIQMVIQSLRANGIKVVAFSGNISSRIDYLENKYNIRRFFDEEVYSFDYGYTKPDDRFVEALIQKVFPKAPKDKLADYGKHIFYIDDNPKDAEPALKYNIPTFIYQRGNIEPLRKKFDELGINVRASFMSLPIK
ncbi:hypothetical protein DFA_01438 [Cavenderia fasciculata]|uniref:HAD-superfamily hydrolase n=1 Tax=Cavenderia fasciculata TaxID=261658 RepID=F4PSS4_CACFS|nr:uncharacterized protein DFA_01438 [Cavenderia fasciculata]EGG21552.1 hypothetical protein DFA_01438 [Cavenderia fasciculata]|eukprot:XP_004359402.1 hypothetical protein DFA_01438 [Cavenderia fasciculata]